MMALPTGAKKHASRQDVESFDTRERTLHGRLVT